MLTYSISTGILKDKTGKVIGQGWAGRDNLTEYPPIFSMNNSNYCNYKDYGPLPIGIYKLLKMDNSKGPYTIYLDPNSENKMYDRGGFRIHGYSAEHPSDSSDGCIIQPHDTRVFVWDKSPDRDLTVIT